MLHGPTRAKKKRLYCFSTKWTNNFGMSPKIDHRFCKTIWHLFNFGCSAAIIRELMGNIMTVSRTSRSRSRIRSRTGRRRSSKSSSSSTVSRRSTSKNKSKSKSKIEKKVRVRVRVRRGERIKTYKSESSQY